MSKDGNTIDHFERANADGSTTIMTSDGEEAFTIPAPTTSDNEATGSTDAGSNEDAGSTDGDSDNGDGGGDEAGGDGGEVPDDGESGEAAAWVDADAAGGIGSAGADYGGVVRGDFLAGAGGSIVDIRFTNTGRPDVVVGGPDTSAPPVVQLGPGGETPQDEAADVFAFSEVDITRLPGVVTTVRPELVERLPTLDPSTLDPDFDPQAFDRGAQMSIDAANISGAALVGLGSLADGHDVIATTDFGSELDVGEFGESGVIGFDGDQGMFGGPDGGPMP